MAEQTYKPGLYVVHFPGSDHLFIAKLGARPSGSSGIGLVWWTIGDDEVVEQSHLEILSGPHQPAEFAQLAHVPALVRAARYKADQAHDDRCSSISEHDCDCGTYQLRDALLPFAMTPAPEEPHGPRAGLYETDRIEAIRQARQFLSGTTPAPAESKPDPRDEEIELRKIITEYLEWGAMTSSDRDMFESQFRAVLEAGK